MEPRSSIFRHGFAMLWARPAAYATVTILPHVVVIGLVMLVGRLIVRLHPPTVGPFSLWNSMDWGMKLFVILALAAMAVIPTYAAARGVCRLALEQRKEASLSLGSVLGDMLRFVPVAVLYFLVLGIPAFLGGFFFVIPGLLINAACALIIPAGIDAQLGPLAAVRRGFSLVGRVFGRVLSICAAYLAFVIVGRVVVTFFFVAVGDAGAITGFLFVAPLILWFLAVLFSIAPAYIMFTLLYYEARDMDAAALAATGGSHGMSSE